MDASVGCHPPQNTLQPLCYEVLEGSIHVAAVVSSALNPGLMTIAATRLHVLHAVIRQGAGAAVLSSCQSVQALCSMSGM
jgi:hypothetical protein